MIQLSTTVEQLIREKMSSGKYGSEDELLLSALHSLDAEDEDLQAIQESLDDLERGEQGIPLDEAFAKLRAEFGIREDA